MKQMTTFISHSNTQNLTDTPVAVSQNLRGLPTKTTLLGIKDIIQMSL